MAIKKKKILLIEPNYSNKYPPIGLMKIASYHRMLNDDVTFYKGEIKDFILDTISSDCINKMNKIYPKINWVTKRKTIKSYIQTKKSELLESLNLEENNKINSLFRSTLSHYSDYYRRKKFIGKIKYDRVYVTTLFTFYWDITIRTINDSKIFVNKLKDLKVGGVMASLLPKEIEKATGIVPIPGLLDKPGMLDKNKIIIDDLPLDYSILDEINYEYPTKSAYFTFMTKGCTRKCSFCSVPKIEPTYKPKINTKDKFDFIKEHYGEQQNLLLMDNNVLASPKFPEIIEEIKSMGFHKGATFQEPNQLSIAIKNLRKGINDPAYIKRSFKLIHSLIERLDKDVLKKYCSILNEYKLTTIESTTKQNLLKSYKHIKDVYESKRLKSFRHRYVDFNQGTDCRYINEANMKLLSEIPIRPLRIAFDYIGIKNQYINAVELAAKYGIKELSNYILYNFKDSPSDLFERLKINIELSERLNVHIFSFPMKFIPLFGEDAKHRAFIGDRWNKKFIRAIQSVLNVTKGIVAPGKEFFEKAFGSNLNEFYEILYMPETYIVYRKVFEQAGWTLRWKEDFSRLNDEELTIAKEIICSNQFNVYPIKKYSNNFKKLINHYTVSRGDIEKKDFEIKKLRKRYDSLIENDMFINLTLTYDYESSNISYG